MFCCYGVPTKDVASWCCEVVWDHGSILKCCRECKAKKLSSIIIYSPSWPIESHVTFCSPWNISSNSQQKHSCSKKCWKCFFFITVRPVSSKSPEALRCQIDLWRRFTVPAKLKVLACTPSEVYIKSIWHLRASGSLQYPGRAILSYFSSLGECCNACFAAKLRIFFGDYGTSPYFPSAWRWVETERILETTTTAG